VIAQQNELNFKNQSFLVRFYLLNVDTDSNTV